MQESNTPPTNSVPSSDFFNNKIENLTPVKQASDLIPEQPIVNNEKIKLNTVVPNPPNIIPKNKQEANLIPNKPEIAANKNYGSLIPNKPEITVNKNYGSLIPNKPEITVNKNYGSLIPDNINTTNINKFNSNILKPNINVDNLVKTESIAKSQSDVSQINQSNKEIMSIEERIKNIVNTQKINREAAPTIVNNYTGANSGSANNVGGRVDGLAGLRMTLRSLPSWRTEMGGKEKGPLRGLFR